MRHAYLNGKKTHAFCSKEDLIRYITEKNTILIAINSEKILNEDAKLSEIINDNIGYPDGVGAVLALRRKGIPAVKIRGAELWLDIIDAYQQEKSFYLLGGTDEVIRKTVETLKKDFPAIRIQGFRNGYFDKVQYAEIKEDIRIKKPNIVFVALGSPKQEYIMADLIQDHSALYMGLGGSFDLYCGKTKPVPEWWNKVFMWEGIYRCFLDNKNLPRWQKQIPALRILYRIAFNRL